MEFPRREGCINWQLVAMLIGGLSFVGSIIGVIPVYLCSYHYSQGSFLDGLIELFVQSFIIVQAVSSALLFFGAKNGKPAWMFPWLGTLITAVVISISVAIALMMNGAFRITNMANLGYFVAALGVAMLVTAVTIFLFVAVYIHYNHLVSAIPTQASSPHAQAEEMTKMDLDDRNI